MSLQPGDVLGGRYRIVRYIAQGGMGAVFEARHVTTEMRVAAKVLFPRSLEAPGARERFELEARIAARTESPHIVKVLDAGVDDKSELAYLVMELLSGEDLHAVVVRRGPLDAKTTLGLLRQVAVGLEAAHGYVGASGKPQPIVHRDLKPENLFVSQPDGPSPFVRILDFGIAKLLGTSHVSTDLKGTPLYMAPEQVRGGAVSARTDIWALGLIAFYALTGKVYWRNAHSESATLLSLLDEIQASTRPPASLRARELGLRGDLPAAFDDFLARCLDPDPARRFATAKEAIDALDGALTGVAPLTASAERTEAGGSPTERSLAPVQSAPPPSRRRSRIVTVAAAIVVFGVVAFALTRRGSLPEPAGVDVSKQGEATPSPAPTAPAPVPAAAPLEVPRTPTAAHSALSAAPEKTVPAQAPAPPSATPRSTAAKRKPSPPRAADPPIRAAEPPPAARDGFDLR